MSELLDLHIYGQEYPHDAVNIIGTRAGLEALALALLACAYSGQPQEAQYFFTNDGEGYAILVKREPIDPLVTPYSDNMYSQEQTSQRWPYKEKQA